MTNQETVRLIAQQCLDRLDNCPDYSRKGKKAQEMCLNYFCGAAALAKAVGDDPLVSYLTNIIAFCIAIRGVEEVERIAKGE